LRASLSSSLLQKCDGGNALLTFMPFSGLANTGFCFFPLCFFPFLPLSGLMEIVDYAGFLYANFQRPLQIC
jgi:hypothetical protein